MKKLFFALITGVTVACFSLFGVVATASAQTVATSEVPQTLSEGEVYLPVPSNTATDSSDSGSTYDSYDPAGPFPLQRTFVISAYYSPLPNQQKYATGSYWGDIRLNGDGVKAADGTEVYPGMIAAPKSYPFGTRMNIPGIGTVAVHDRGGAIVLSGERGNVHDRLDVWMGYGDAGLKRALKWGKRTVNVTVYGIDSSIREEVYLEGYSDAEKYAVANTLTFSGDANATSPQIAPTAEEKALVFGTTPAPGGTGDDVKKIQEILKNLNYHTGDVNGVFDEATLAAVKKFQVDEKIVSHEGAFGAGYVGPKTMKVLAGKLNVATANAAADTFVPVEVFTRDLASGDTGEDVRLLQEELRRVHLLGIEPTGNYGEVTAHAVLKFQQIHQLAGDKNSPGAGIFGPKTRSALNALLAERQRTEKLIADRRRQNDSV